MARDDVTPTHAGIGVIFPASYAVDYAEAVRDVSKFSDQQGYTIRQIYDMVRVDLENAGVSSERVSLSWFLFFFREILNDYSAKVEEFQVALVFTGGGGVFRIPSLHRVIKLDVNGYGATSISEQGMTAHRAAEATLRTNEFLYSVNGNLLSLYPAVGSSDQVTLFASVFADTFSEDSVHLIIPQADYSILYHGCRWKCRESYGKDYMEAKMAYMKGIVERKSRVERQLYPTQLRPANIL